jgi:hypothetical protein
VVKHYKHYEGLPDYDFFIEHHTIHMEEIVIYALPLERRTPVGG